MFRNKSETSTSFILLGLVEMENFKFLYSGLAFCVYILNICVCYVIIFIVWTEISLHEPMFIFICTLIFNGLFGSSTILPKLIIDLISGSFKISLSSCLVQSFFLHSFAAIEVFTFTLMAQDRYLAVGDPLRYSTLMTNAKALRYIMLNCATAFIVAFVPVTMTSFLPMCGTNINNVFCENMSLLNLACGDASFNNIFGVVESFLIAIGCLLVIVYCYIRTFIICLRISKEAYQKAIRTLVTHITAFSIFSLASFFILLRYRLNSGFISLTTHVSITVVGFLIPITLNPIIYGMRTEALKIKIVHKFQKFKVRNYQ